MQITALSQTGMSKFKDVCTWFGVSPRPRKNHADIDNQTIIWGPIMSVNNTVNPQDDWNNIIFNKGDIIIEWSNSVRKEQKNFHWVINGTQHKRITFGKINGQFVFMGVYELDMNLTSKIGRLVWRRLYEEIEITMDDTVVECEMSQLEAAPCELW